jgi:hypothetical protein
VKARPWRPLARAAALVGAPLLLIGALVWPMLFTSSYFIEDWLEQVWFVWHQSMAIQAHHLPTLFLNYPFGVFYPHYAFYGGTLYAATATLSLLLGGALLETYVLTYVLGFAAAYGGWWWIGRMCGLGRWRAQAPGLVFITSSYYLTLIYGRGDWPEFIGVSMIPLVIAGGLCVLRAERLRLWPALALAVSCTMLFGSHTLTVVWGSTVLALVAVAILVCVPDARRAVTRRGLMRVVGLVVPALLVNAWFLLPTLAYGSHTLIGSEYGYWRHELRVAMYLVSTHHLFTLSRASATNTTPSFALSLPILAIAWVLVSIAIVLVRDRRGAWVRTLVIVSTVSAGIAVLMTHAGLLLALPRLYSTLQFSYRLESYVLLGLSGAVLAVLVIVEGRAPRRGHGWSLTLGAVLLVSAIGAIQQAAAYPHIGERDRELHKFETVITEVPLVDYTDSALPRLNYGGLPGTKPVVIDFPTTSVPGDPISVVTHLLPGQLAYTNLEGGPNLVHITGAKIVGIDSQRDSVIAIEASPQAARAASKHPTSVASSVPSETITLSPANTLPVVAGRLLSVLGAILLALELGVLALRRR